MEFLNEEIISIIYKVVNFLLEPHLVVGVENGQEKIHQQEQPKDQKPDEIDSIQPPHFVRRQHEVREVGRGHEHQESKRAFPERGEVLNAFGRSPENGIANPGKEEDVESDEHDHLR